MSERVERGDWESGPWDGEPDALDWIDASTGYPVAMRRNPFGAWCAYIGIPTTHPWHGLGYRALVKAPETALQRAVDVDELGAISLLCAVIDANPEEGIFQLGLLVRCHGGLTWAADCVPMEPADGRWWFGFDCSHAGDRTPSRRLSLSGVYRDVAYVQTAAAKACADLLAAIPPHNPTPNTGETK